mmetsp:Transcript_58790/g.118083  ORF Transcript_58790/g.118083 Transcript_58790/m.118083 type:complete len:467 (+) Transcript_58790:83-1483(+)|eukprot:CAMPEP_0171722772 /NCGR_PEP_ID=MMETSP0991-20121206/23241_1 /TAXON_ID=483369 /ORGANISM="non described non described, Strain CCMP2098" /LENGTH=466 /DNA_ID=CAMNT_0012315071 /DNA_START=67 /DNA_END=1467 /DNA_ORIENTATION=+
MAWNFLVGTGDIVWINIIGLLCFGLNCHYCFTINNGGILLWNQSFIRRIASIFCHYEIGVIFLCLLTGIGAPFFTGGIVLCIPVALIPCAVIIRWKWGDDQAAPSISPRTLISSGAVASRAAPPTALMATDKSKGTAHHSKYSSLLDDFPASRLLLSVVFWLAISLVAGCYSGALSVCRNDHLTIAFFYMAVSWVTLIYIEKKGVLFGIGGSDLYSLAQDSDIESFTSGLCLAAPSFQFTAQCYHTKTTQGTQQTATETMTVVTHKAEQVWPPEGTRLRSTELSGSTLKLHRVFGDISLPWRDSKGRPHITRSKGGIVEVRVPVPRISFASEELDHEFASAFTAFKTQNTQDEAQEFAVVVSLMGYPEHGKKVFNLHKAASSNPYKYIPSLFMLLGLGWLYQMWYNSISAVVNLPLHKSIEIVSLEAHDTAVAIPGMISNQGDSGVLRNETSSDLATAVAGGIEII